MSLNLSSKTLSTAVPRKQMQPILTLVPQQQPSVLLPVSNSNIALSRRRWFVLASFSMLSFMNAWMWIAWSPFVEFCTALWSVHESKVDQLASVYFYMCLFVIFPALYAVQRYGLRNSLYFSSMINFVGASLRYGCMNHYVGVYVGTMCCAVSSAFSMTLPTFLSAEWFGSHERATATTIGVLAEHFGIAAGLGATMVVPINYESVVRYTFAQFALSGFAMLAIFTFVNEDCPKIPPSAAAAHKKQMISVLHLATLNGTTTSSTSKGNSSKDTTTTSLALSSPPQDDWNTTTTLFNPYYLYRQILIHNNDDNSNNDDDDERTIKRRSSFLKAEIIESYKQTIISLLSNRSVFIFAIVYGVCVGVFDAICTFLSQYLPYEPKECGIMGILFVMVGFIGSFLVAFFMDTFTTKYWVATFATTVGCALSMIFLWLVVWLAVGSRIFVYLAITLNGIFLSALISAGFEYVAAITYPADENIVSGLLNCFSHVIAWVLIECKELVAPGESDFFRYNAMLSALLVTTCFLFFNYVEGESKRPFEPVESSSDEEEEVFIRR